MRAILLSTALILPLAAIPAQAKVWHWSAYSLTGGVVKPAGTGAECNYQSAVGAARAAADAVPDGALSLRGVEGKCQVVIAPPAPDHDPGAPATGG